MSSDFKIGTSLMGITSIDSVLVTPDAIDPDWSFQPYSQSIRLGNGLLKGQGFPIAKWRWNAMDDSNREILKSYVGSNLSAEVYIQTATNDSVYGDIIFEKYKCIMNWPPGDEDFQSDKVLGLIIIFTHMEIQLP